MATNDYHFITHWRSPGTTQEISDVLGDAVALMDWWPSVYLDVKITEMGDDQGVGRVVELFTKGFLPYTLRWRFRVTESRAPHGFSLEAQGDFEGRGIWTFLQSGDFVDVTYDWKIRADKPLLKNFSLVMKPLFEANHRWAMAKGEESLMLELARRRAKTPEDRDRVPDPPPATWPTPKRPRRALAAR